MDSQFGLDPQFSLAALKEWQRRMRARGDYAAVGADINAIAEDLVDAAAPAAGAAVLDVATGGGNAAIAAARRGCSVTGLDSVAKLLEQARTRAAAEGLPVEFVEGDAEELPFSDGAFDLVLSCVGVMYAADQERAAGELLRVCRSGGRIALANWTPDGFVGELFEVMGSYAPPPPGLRPATEWGTVERLGELLGDSVASLRADRREYVFRHSSAEAFIDFLRAGFGPMMQAFETLEHPMRIALHTDLVALCRKSDRGRGGLEIPATYLQAVAVRA